MKQYPPTAKNQLQLISLLIAALTLSASACARLPRKLVSETPPTLNVQEAASGLHVNINTASAQELEQLPGIGEVMAELIIAHRTQYGPFRRAEHLMMVHGISDRKFREIRPMIVAE